MEDLMVWAQKMPENIQKQFAEFYHLNQYDALNDEMLGGRMDESTITRQMMRWLIAKFEKGLGLTPTFLESEIYQ